MVCQLEFLLVVHRVCLAVGRKLRLVAVCDVEYDVMAWFGRNGSALGCSNRPDFYRTVGLFCQAFTGNDLTSVPFPCSYTQTEWVSKPSTVVVCEDGKRTGYRRCFGSLHPTSYGLVGYIPEHDAPSGTHSIGRGFSIRLVSD